MENDRPEYLYRGMCIKYEDLKNFTFSGIDMELPYEPYIDSQGNKTVHDGNEYGIYMSDNPKVAKSVYGNASHKKGTFLEPHIAIGITGEYISIPEIGLCYKISTQNLDIRKPWIKSEFRGLYNNGFEGNEWITNKIPADNYEIMSVQIGTDLLHDEQYVELDDIEHIKEKIIEILEQRKARLEVFAQDMGKIPKRKRESFSLEHLDIFKEIYGENGFKYMESIDEIDFSSQVGMIRYLMANVYKDNTENINYDTLLYLQDIKERARFAQKKGKEFDLKEYLSKDLENIIKRRDAYIEKLKNEGKEINTNLYDKDIAQKEKMLEIVKQKENEHINVSEAIDKNSKLGSVAPVSQSQENSKTSNDKKEVENGKSDKAVLNASMVDYYKKYGILKSDDWETIKQKLKNELKKWTGRENSTNAKDTLAMIEGEIDEITEGFRIFNPKNTELRRNYDESLRRKYQMEKQEENLKSEEILQDEVEKEKSGQSLSKKNIVQVLKSNPISLNHLKEVQHEIGNQVKSRKKDNQLRKSDSIDR